MTSKESDSQLGLGRLEIMQKHRQKLIGSTREVSVAVALFVLPLAVFTIVQYLRYGFGLFLGWDTPTYVWWAELVYLNGPLTLVHWAYPNFYTLAVAGFGMLVGSASTAERILPFLVATPLAYGYYRLATEITSDKKLGYLGALVGGLTVTTLRLYSDLHRNLLSFGVSIVVGALISSVASEGNFSWRHHRKQAILLWLPLLAVAAYTQIETYALLALSLTLYFWTQKARTALVGMLLLATPILVALPLIWPFLLSYPAGLQLLGQPTPAPTAVLGDSLLFLGGLSLPWTLIGLADIVRQARLGVQSAKFVALWLLATLLLLPVGIPLGFPYYRFLYIIPVPVLVVAGVASTLRYGSSLERRGFLRRFSPLKVRNRPLKRSILVPSAVALLLTATLITSIASDLFLRPYVSQAEVDRVIEAAEMARQLGYAEPILVMYGPTAADFNPIYRAYFGIQIPESLAYYGKLQYLFTLPDPGRVYQWQFDPPFEQASSLKYRSEILNQLSAPLGIASHAVIIAGGKTYDRPLSELFIQRFQLAPGIYIIPPGQLTSQDIDSWRLFAYSDYTNVTRSSVANATLSSSGKILSWVDRSPKANFEANYTVSLASAWQNMTLTVRFFDWPQPLVFPDTSTALLAPLGIYFDGSPVLSHNYGGLGAFIPVNRALSGVSAGVHTITVRSGSPGLAVAVGLDSIKLCPAPC